MRGCGLLHRSFATRRIGHVAGDRDAVKLPGDRTGSLLVDINNNNLGAGRSKARAEAAPKPDAPPVTWPLSLVHQNFPSTAITAKIKIPRKFVHQAGSVV